MDEKENEATKNKNKNSNEDEHEFHIEDMKLYITAYSTFVKEVMELDWPENHALPNDPKMMRIVFTMFWKQRHRQRLEEERMERKRKRQPDENYEATEFMRGGNEHFKKFLRHHMESHSDEDEYEDEPVFIDPGEIKPDEKHSTEEAIGRQDRFREEWE